MNRIEAEDQVFEKSALKDGLAAGNYENCTFVDADLSGTDLSNSNFSDCTFERCNLSNTKLNNTGLKNAAFINCKMLGLRFDHCNTFLFELTTDNCTLNLSSFYGCKLRKMTFKNTTFHEADFSEADLSNSVFNNCDLAGSVFDNTNLEKAELSTSYNYTIDPENNRITKASFSKDGLPGLLTRYEIKIT